MRWLLLLILLADDHPALHLKVRPTIAFAPSSLYVEIRLHPITSDRVVAVTADGPEFFRSSAWTVEGTHAAKLFSWVWRDAPAGEYGVRAQIGNGRTWRATAYQRVTLLGMPEKARQRWGGCGMGGPGGSCERARDKLRGSSCAHCGSTGAEVGLGAAHRAAASALTLSYSR